MAGDQRLGQRKPAKGNLVRFWQEQDDKRMARAMVDWANRIESGNWLQRFNLWRYYRYLTGQTAYYSYTYSTSVTRPTEVNALSRARFSAPVKNVIANCYNALNNRIYKNHVALLVVPDAGNNDANLESRTQTRYLDAMFSNGLWPLVEEAGMDACVSGSGFIQVDNGLDGKDICWRVIKPDEILVDPAEASVNQVTTMVIRRFVNRYELADQFPDFRVQIVNAPPAQLGFATNQSVDVSDVIVLREGFHLGDDETGIRALVLEPDVCLQVDRKEREHFNVAKLIHMPLGFWGKGSVQDTLPLQRSHDRISRAFEENMVRFAWPRVGIINGSNVNEGEIAAASSLFYHYNMNMKPTFELPQAIGPDMFKYQADLERGILDGWGVSEQEVSGQPTGADASGRARLVQDQINDRRHVQLLQNLELFIEDVGYLLIEAAQKVHPKFVSVGKSAQAIEYPGFSKTVKLRAFPMSAFPRSVAGFQDELDRALAQGRISKETYDRVSRVPDIDMESDINSASHDLLVHTLDEIVRTGKILPPSGLGDLPAAYEYTRKRIEYEQRRNRDDKTVSALFQFLMLLDEQIQEASGNPAPVAAPAGPAVPGQEMAQATTPNAPSLPATI